MLRIIYFFMTYSFISNEIDHNGLHGAIAFAGGAIADFGMAIIHAGFEAFHGAVASVPLIAFKAACAGEVLVDGSGDQSALRVIDADHCARHCASLGAIFNDYLLAFIGVKDVLAAGFGEYIQVGNVFGDGCNDIACMEIGEGIIAEIELRKAYRDIAVSLGLYLDLDQGLGACGVHYFRESVADSHSAAAEVLHIRLALCKGFVYLNSFKADAIGFILQGEVIASTFQSEPTAEMVMAGYKSRQSRHFPFRRSLLPHC